MDSRGASETTKSDLVTGGVTRAVFRLAFPAVSMLYLQALYNIVDTMWVGRLGPKALAGISTGGFVLWTIFALVNIVSVGIHAAVARRMGEGDRAEAGRVASQGVAFAVIASVVLGAGLLALRGPLFSLMQTSLEVTDLGSRYLTVLLYGIPTLFLSATVTSILQASGDTYTPMKLVFWSLLLNAVLDPLLIFGLAGFPALGIAGASVATVCARLFFVVWGLRILWKGRRGLRVGWPAPISVDWRLFARVARIGLPPALAGFTFSFIYMILVRVVGDYGDHGIAALRIGHIVEFINYCTGLGFSTAAATMVGQNLGAGAPDRAERSVYRILVILSALIGTVTVFFFVVPSGIVSLFSSDPRVIAMGSVYPGDPGLFAGVHGDRDGGRRRLRRSR